MSENLHEWLNLLLRWFHVIVGIIWIGGFYQIERRWVTSDETPATLHEFKWEAALTWVSGFCLLCVVYYMRGGAFLIDREVSSISAGAATALGIGLLVFAWFFYDTMYRSPLAKMPKLAAAISFALVVGVAYGLTHVFRARAAYMQVGAMLGTLMALNVWVRILPLGEHARRRSVHNSYMMFPVVFVMISNHFPMTYGNRLSWLVLGGIFLASVGVRYFMNARNRYGGWVLASSVVLIAALIVWTDTSRGRQAADLSTVRVPFEKVNLVIRQRCATCHSSSPSDDVFRIAPNGVMLDRPEQIHAMAERMRWRAVLLKTMPFANKTGMTQEERDLLGRWIAQGAKID